MAERKKCPEKNGSVHGLAECVFVGLLYLVLNKKLVLQIAVSFQLGSMPMNFLLERSYLLLLIK